MASTLLDLILLGTRSSAKIDFAPIEHLINGEFSSKISLRYGQSHDEVIHFVESRKRPSVIITTLNPNDEKTENLLQQIRGENRISFIVLFSSEACVKPSLR
jgi:nucleoside-diphosphate-sugar epimerase